LVLKHRGSGKLPIALAHLPPSLTSLALKKALLTVQDHYAEARARERLRQQQQVQQQQEQVQPPQEQEEQQSSADSRRGRDLASPFSAPSAASIPWSRRPSATGGAPEAAATTTSSSSAALPPRPPSRQRSLPPTPQQQEEEQQQQQLPPPLFTPSVVADDQPAAAPQASSPGPSHAVESPQFNRDVRLGNVSAPDLTQLAPPGSSRAATPSPSERRAASACGAAAGSAAQSAAGGAGAEEVAPRLRGLRALFLHTSLMECEVAAHVGGVSTQLTQLAVVGPDGAPTEEQEVWLKQAMAGRLGALQVGWKSCSRWLCACLLCLLASGEGDLGG